MLMEIKEEILSEEEINQEKEFSDNETSEGEE